MQTSLTIRSQPPDKTAMTLPILLLAALAAPALAADVASFVARRDRCTHWADEEPYDRARAAQIAAAMRRLRCAAVDADEARLRKRYARDAAALKPLDARAGD
jgi:hypothetical protein